MKIYNSSQNNLIADSVELANNFITRSIGLISKTDLKNNQGLIIKPCNSIHTFFMKFNIDVIFVNKKHEIIAVYENVTPYKILPIHFTSDYVIELNAGVVSEKNIKKGNIIEIHN